MMQDLNMVGEGKGRAKYAFPGLQHKQLHDQNYHLLLRQEWHEETRGRQEFTVRH